MFFGPNRKTKDTIWGFSEHIALKSGPKSPLKKKSRAGRAEYISKMANKGLPCSLVIWTRKQSVVASFSNGAISPASKNRLEKFVEPKHLKSRATSSSKRKRNAIFFPLRTKNFSLTNMKISDLRDGEF